MTHRLLPFVFVSFLPFVPSLNAQHQHPAGPTSATATTALSAEAVQQLLGGDGMGLAKPAELTGYPGPKHVLEHASELALTTEQEAKIKAIRQEVVHKAKAIGARIVDSERSLDGAFKSGRITSAELSRRLTEIAALQGDLRRAHLDAHLATKPVLSAEQIRKYYELRSK